MKIAHFFDIDTIISKKEMVWIVDKTSPNIPLLKISKSDFKLIKSGIYKSQGNKIEFNGETFWIDTNLFNRIKVKSKNDNVSLENIAISLQEFFNKKIIDERKFDIDMSLLSKLKNTNDDLYIICSSELKRTHDSFINKLKEQLKEQGILIKCFYHISETFYNQNLDDVKLKKQKLLIQHSIGYKTDLNKFTDEEITRYDEVNFYDNNYDTINYSSDINKVFNTLLNNSDNGIKNVIVEDIKEYNPLITINQVYSNVVNKIQSKSVQLKVSNLMTFESFTYNKK